MLPRLVLTPGDPTGIGPEIAAKACRSHLLNKVEITLLGEADAIVTAFERWGDPSHLYVGREVFDRRPGMFTIVDTSPKSHALDVAPEARAIRQAVEGCLGGIFDAMVTGPISKKRLTDRGFPHPGHTQYLAELTNASRPIMTFVSKRLRVALVTNHIPLSQVSNTLSRQAIVETIKTASNALRDLYGLDQPRLAVCGLNPHAGEGGLLGTEEIEVIGPAIAEARAAGINVSGPHPSDTIFGEAIRGQYDLIVALYHDQGLIPVKLLGLGSSVHLTLGLPIIRTSVDHGTAHDIAGQGIANPAGLEAAISEAIVLSNGSRHRRG